MKKKVKGNRAGKPAIEQTYTDQLRQVFGDNLLSVMLYGSYVSGSYVRGVSDINILVILEASDPAQLDVLGTKTHRLMRRHRITPLIMTRAQFRNSADVFPMEYADISERNRVLFGEDETGSLNLEKGNLRHQLEERLRGVMSSLRQIIIASRGRKRILGNNLKMLVGSLNALFRGLLRLKGIEDIPNEVDGIVEEMSRIFGMPASPFQKLLRLRRGERSEVNTLAREMLTALEELIGIVDGMEF
jgi:predicted nucleotidyltransferase